MAKVQQAVDAAFDPAGDDRGLRRHLQGPHHRRALRRQHHATTPLESWSMGKSLSGTLMGVLIKQGVYTLDQAGARFLNGRRPAIRARRSASRTSCTCRAGCASSAPQDPITMRTAHTPIISTSTPAAWTHSSMRRRVRSSGRRTRVGRYRNTDPVLTNYLIRLARREARRGLPLVPAARAVRQDRHPHDGAGHRSLRKLSHARLRAGIGARLGTHRATCICRTASGTASASCPKATPNSSARSRRRGWPTSVRSMAGCSG